MNYWAAAQASCRLMNYWAAARAGCASAAMNYRASAWALRATVSFRNRLRSEGISWKLLQDFQSHCKYHLLVSKLPLLQRRLIDATEASFEIRD
jgi:hypothetical protein